MNRSRRVLNEVICERLVTSSKRFFRGATWAHVLDAEPLAMTNMDDGFVFVLWNRGAYAFNVNGVERWRAPPPAWPNYQNFQ